MDRYFVHADFLDAYQNGKNGFDYGPRYVGLRPDGTTYVLLMDGTISALGNASIDAAFVLNAVKRHAWIEVYPLAKQLVMTFPAEDNSR